MKVVGSIHLYLHVQNAPQPRRIHFIIAEDLVETLVGCSDLISLGVLPTNFPAFLNTDSTFQASTEAQTEEGEK